MSEAPVVTKEPLSLTALTVSRCLYNLPIEEKKQIFFGRAEEPPPLYVVTIIAVCFAKGNETPSKSRVVTFSSLETFQKELESDDPFDLVKSLSYIDDEWYRYLIGKWKESLHEKNIKTLNEIHFFVNLFSDAQGALCSELVFTRTP